MTARSANSFLTSLLIHGLAVAGLFGYAYFLHDEEPKTKIIELVAGEGDNYGATEAPALGSPDSKANNPDAAAAAESSPIAPAPLPEPKPMEAVATPPVAPAHPVQRAPDFIRQMNRVEKRTQAKIDKREKAEAERQAKLEAEREKQAEKQAAQAVKNNQMTKEEFDRRFGNKANSASASKSSSSSQVKVAKIDTQGIAGGVRGGSTKNTKGGAGGTALTREEADELDAYFSMLLARLKDAHQRPEGLSDLLTAKVEFYIDHDGTISGVSIIRTSGSPEFDQSVLSAFRKVGSIGPRPDSGGRLRREVTFKMRDD